MNELYTVILATDGIFIHNSNSKWVNCQAENNNLMLPLSVTKLLRRDTRRDELRRRVRDVHNPHWGKFWINTEGNNYRQVLAGGEAIDSQVNGV
jgi:hypothetical protein